MSLLYVMCVCVCVRACVCVCVLASSGACLQLSRCCKTSYSLEEILQFTLLSPRA